LSFWATSWGPQPSPVAIQTTRLPRKRHSDRKIIAF
jgi:hypothetical protein